MKNLRLRLLSNLVIVYMLLAFSWWSILLFKKNDDAFLAKAELLKVDMLAAQRVHSEEAFYQSKEYHELAAKYKRQEWMILGEAAVFVLSLVIGIYLINRAYHSEIQAAENRRNFLLSITHELKSPIASILLVLETLLKRQLSIQQQSNLAQNALNETHRLNTLVNNLLLAARLDSTYQLYKEKIDLKNLLPLWVERFTKNTPNLQVTISANENSYSLLADKEGLHTIVSNLIENAIKYTPNPPKIQLSLSKRKGGILLRIADNGHGISDKEKKRIFERFYRIGSEDTRKTKGTGLGLYIVNQIVKAHNGSIKVLDKQGGGSIFEIWLP